MEYYTRTFSFDRDIIRDFRNGQLLVMVPIVDPCCLYLQAKGLYPVYGGKMLLRTVGTHVPRNMVSSPRRYRRDDHSSTALHVLLLVSYKLPHFAMWIATH